jgi:hypothetical protein
LDWTAKPSNEFQKLGGPPTQLKDGSISRRLFMDEWIIITSSLVNNGLKSIRDFQHLNPFCVHGLLTFEIKKRFCQHFKTWVLFSLCPWLY